MPPLQLKQIIRAFFEERMAHSRKEAIAFGFVAGIVVRDQEMEKFIDELWVHIQKNYPNSATLEETKPHA